MVLSCLRNVRLVWVGMALVCGCHRPEGSTAGSTPSHPDAVTATHSVGAASNPKASAAVKVSESDALRARDDLPPEQRALVVVNGAERWVDAKAIELAGYTIVDLRDTWTPSIFAEEKTPEGEPLPNRYRRVLIGMANDQLDNDGEPLAPGEKNYLRAVRGVPIAVGAARALPVRRFARVSRTGERGRARRGRDGLGVRWRRPTYPQRDEAKLARINKELETARVKGKFATLQVVAASTRSLAAKVRATCSSARRRRLATWPQSKKRLACTEGLLTPKSKHIRGQYDDAMRLAVRTFQQKHMIYEQNYLRRKTVDALARPLVDNDYDALVRVLRERVVSAAGVIEDETAGNAKQPVRNLVEEYTQATVHQLGLVDAASTLAFFQRHPPEQFQTLRAAVKLAARPEYYTSQMDLSIVVDRGDVWYDLPFDAQGNFSPHSRKRYPSLTLYVTYNGQKIPLARWRTTIGGWRAEQASDGYEYYRYKASDVGPRVIRQIISGPVWIPPTSTPIRSLVKGKLVNGHYQRIVNYDELGAGYLSAYGLIAGYFVVLRPKWSAGLRQRRAGPRLVGLLVDLQSDEASRTAAIACRTTSRFACTHSSWVIATSRSRAISR